MLSIQLLSIQIDISWNKKLKTNRNEILRHIHVNDIEKKMNEMKYKYNEYIRFM